MEKKPDLRDRAKGKATVTDNNAKRAGEGERSSIGTPRTEMHAVTPEIGKHLAEGQVTKSN